MATLVIPEHHRLRGKAEQFIRQVYEEEYGAQLSAFPRRLLVKIGQQGEILCAAGLRTSAEGFFSERYLDTTVETALARVQGQPVARERIFETSTFASRSPRAVPLFIGQIIDWGENSGFEWSFFTITRRARRFSTGSAWISPRSVARIPPGSKTQLLVGSYTTSRSRAVYAVNRDCQIGNLAARRQQAVNA